MNILIPNSWLKDYLETNATPQQFADAMSLTSVSIERIEHIEDDYIYDIEVTTNRPDLMSIEGIAREASAVLPQAGFSAKFKPRQNLEIKTVKEDKLISIQNDSTLVNRIIAVVMEIDLKPSPTVISKRLEKTGIRSINNVVDVTNYIMREVGHPAHVFDYDRLTNHNLIIRQSKKGETLTTLDQLNYELSGGDIVADDGTGTIVDLLGVMGTANSVVTNDTKRIVLFLDNNKNNLIRKTSMGLGIRTEAAVLNEKGVDPELMLPAISRGIELLKEIANAKLLSGVIDIYPNKPAKKSVSVTYEKINSLIGIEIPEGTVVSILQDLGFTVRHSSNNLVVEVPTTRVDDVEIPEDIIEEVARVYGYHKIPNLLPTFSQQQYYHQEKNEFYWIVKIKEAFKYWGFNEVYTYSLVAEEQFEGPIENALKLKNPLDEDHVYLRNTLIPSILKVIEENKKRESFKLFEVSNVYIKKEHSLPDESLRLAGVVKGEGVNFYTAKGIVEAFFSLLGIEKIKFQIKEDGITGSIIKMDSKSIGYIEAEEEITFEIDLTEVLKSATLRKVYVPPSKFPPIIEDVRLEIDPHYTFQSISKEIKQTSELVFDVILLDVYKNKKTFRITFLDLKKNLTNEDVAPIREKIYKHLEREFKAKIG